MTLSKEEENSRNVYIDARKQCGYALEKPALTWNRERTSTNRADEDYVT